MDEQWERDRGEQHARNKLALMVASLRKAADDIEREAAKARPGFQGQAAAAAVDSLMWALGNLRVGTVVHHGGRADLAQATGQWSI